MLTLTQYKEFCSAWSLWSTIWYSRCYEAINLHQYLSSNWVSVDFQNSCWSQRYCGCPLQHLCLTAAIVAVYWEQLFGCQAHFPLNKGVGNWQTVCECVLAILIHASKSFLSLLCMWCTLTHVWLFIAYRSMCVPSQSHVQAECEESLSVTTVLLTDGLAPVLLGALCFEKQRPRTARPGL